MFRHPDTPIVRGRDPKHAENNFQLMRSFTSFRMTKKVLYHNISGAGLYGVADYFLHIKRVKGVV